MRNPARQPRRLVRLLAGLLIMALGLPLAAQASGADNACVQCHPSPGALYLESLAGAPAQTQGCPVLDRLARRLRAVQVRLLALEENLTSARAAGIYVEPGARRLDRARARLAWFWGIRLESEAQAQTWLGELEREIGEQVAPDMIHQAGRERGRVGLALVLVAGLGLLLAWLVGRRRELGEPGPDVCAEIRQGRLP